MGGKGSGRHASTSISYVGKPYERQPRETSVAWRAFFAYRDMGDDRSIAKTSDLLGKKDGYIKTLERWSRVWGWVHRVVEWDKVVDDVRRKEALKAAAKKSRAMVNIVEAMVTLGGNSLKQWDARMRAAHERTEKTKRIGKPLFSVTETEKLIATGIKLDRLLDDKPTDITKHEVTDISEAKAKLYAALAGRRTADDDNDTPMKSEEDDDT